MTRMLSLLGAELPKHLMLGHEDNPAGFWEPQSVADLNDEILNALDSDWDDVFAFRPRSYLSNFDRYYFGRAVELLEAEFDGAELIVLKDPRISILTNFWDRALREAGYAVNYVVMVRNPLEVAESLRIRDGFPREKSLLLWSSYMIACERDTRDCPRNFVSYDQLLSDWRSVRRAVEAMIGMPFPRDTAAAVVDIERHLDRRLRHHQAMPQDIFSRADISDDIKTLVRIFFEAAAGGPLDQAALDSIQRRMADLDMLVGPLLADLRTRTRSLIKDVATLNDAHAGARQQADDLAKLLATEKAARQSDIDILQRQKADLQDQLATVKVARDTEAEAYHREREELAYRVQAAAEERDRLAGEVEEASRRVDALNDHITAVTAERNQVASQVGDKDSRIASLTVEATALRVSADAARGELTELQQRIDGIDAEVEQAIRAVQDQVERRIAEVRSERNQVAAELRAEQERIQELEGRAETLTCEREHFRAIATAAEAKLVKFERRLEDVEAEFEDTMRLFEERARLERDRLTTELQATSATLTRFRNSVSWRLTRPVRWVGRSYKRLMLNNMVPPR
jgi:hypothetical protein